MSKDLVLALVLALAPEVGGPRPPWKIVRVGDLNVARYACALTVLGDGRVLVTGGSVGESGHETRAAEVYDPATRTFSVTGRMNVPRRNHSAVLLADGRVLVVGGRRAGLVRATETAEVWDPKDGTFRLTGPMTQERGDRPTAIRLLDGRVLVAGGAVSDSYGTATDTVDVFEPRTNSFHRVGTLAMERAGAAASLLADGRVLVVGGGLRCCSHPASRSREASWEVFDPATGRSKPGGTITQTAGTPRLAITGDGRTVLAYWETLPPGRRILRTEPIDAGSLAVACHPPVVMVLPDGWLFDSDFWRVWDDATGREVVLARDLPAPTAAGPLSDGSVLLTSTIFSDAMPSPAAWALLPVPMADQQR